MLPIPVDVFRAKMGKSVKRSGKGVYSGRGATVREKKEFRKDPPPRRSRTIFPVRNESVQEVF